MWKTIVEKLVVSLGFVVVYYFTQHIAWLYVAGSMTILLFLPYTGSFIMKGWYSLGKILGMVNTTIILSLVYFIVLVPVSLFRKLFSKDSLMLKNKNDSFFITRDHTFAPKDFNNPW